MIGMTHGRSRLAVVLLANALYGCATLERGETDEIPVQTVPAGANVISAGGAACTSPCNIPARRRDIDVVTISKPGYATQTFVLQSRRIAGTEGRDAPAPSLDLLSRAADARTYADFEHVPGSISVVLAPAPAAK